MRHIASRFTSARAIGLATIAAAGGAFALTTAGTAVAATAVTPPTISVNWTPSEIGVGDSSGITYTIANKNTSGSLANISFTDTLPSFTSLDNPTGQTVASTCGTSPVIGAIPGSGTVTAQAITIKAGTSCTISLSVVGNAVGNGPDTLSSANYAPSTTSPTGPVPAANLIPAALDVLADPTVAVTTPTNNTKYTYGEKVAVAFTCDAPSDANGSTLTPGGCIATDDLGNVYNPGDDLDTTDPGVHTLDVEANDNLGDTADADITYTVLPSNIVKLNKDTVGKKGALSLNLAVPGAGTLTVSETSGKTTVATTTEKLSRLYTALAIGLKPNPAGLKLLGKTGKLRVILTVAYTPKGGAAHAFTKVVTLTGTKTKVVTKKTKTKTKTKAAA